VVARPPGGAGAWREVDLWITHIEASITSSSTATENCSPETPLAYQRSGRGFWFAEWPEQPDATVALQYHDTAGLEVLRGETRRAVSRMVREYDPSWQFVVVIAEQDDSIRAYKVGFVDPSGN
jgi:hypothetical protein